MKSLRLYEPGESVHVRIRDANHDQVYFPLVKITAFHWDDWRGMRYTVQTKDNVITDVCVDDVLGGVDDEG